VATAAQFLGIRRRLPRGLAGVVFWLAVWFCIFSLLRLIPGETAAFFGVLQVFAGLALAGLAIPVLWRLIRRRMLWSLRNKLVLTYLLIGLAPIVLFVTLVLISAYIAAGQFAIHLADSRVQSELDWLSSQNANLESRMIAAAEPQGKATVVNPDQPSSGDDVYTRQNGRSLLRPEISAFVNGQPLLANGIANHGAKTPLGLPPWALRLPDNEFRGIVLDGSDLFLVAIHQHPLADGRRLSLVSSFLMDERLMARLADGLGRAGMVALLAGRNNAQTAAASGVGPSSANNSAAGRAPENPRTSVFGGEEPAPLNLLDLRVRFLSTLPTVDWDGGERDSVPIEVISRPSLLYRQLFGGSLSGIVTSVIRVFLLVLCIVFALIEILALWMAARLSRTVTASIADLYEATRRIDRGDLGYRVQVDRDDQVAELGRSFNTMTGSLQRLLKEQKEKERLQNEISIAQEVQANLFPQRDCDLPNLELHGVCRPARSVSGDYYDFLTFHGEPEGDCTERPQVGVGIALGDISGKGISAALLMATLHSAVRAYRFASEELVYVGSASEGLQASRDDRGDRGELFHSPGKILALLNRHLYRSTQPEKYATLFLAHYESSTSNLTYSNAGQLPPLVLGRDGTVRRLDRGGTVVGLMDGMQYEEGRVPLRPGDIVIAYSDGVTEPENDFGEFGEERLLEVVRRYSNEPLHFISAQVMQALDAWIGAEEQPDDITLVLARQI
jgi:sigma-B regulation protein RsbU (phosphoserine phosphatase)